MDQQNPFTSNSNPLISCRIRDELIGRVMNCHPYLKTLITDGFRGKFLARFLGEKGFKI